MEHGQLTIQRNNRLSRQQTHKVLHSARLRLQSVGARGHCDDVRHRVGEGADDVRAEVKRHVVDGVLQAERKEQYGRRKAVPRA